MDFDKIAIYITKLRKDNNLTQQQLADMIPISRQAISKWERGITIPDPTTLLKLSQIFNKSINELLLGKDLNVTHEVDDLTLSLYKKNKKKEKNIKLLYILFCLFIFLAIFTFFVYYFINSYKKVEVFTIRSNDNEINGLFIKTREIIYMYLEPVVLNDEKIIEMKLNFNNRTILSINDSNNIFLKDYVGYEEYFDFKNIDEIIKNLYLVIEYDNGIKNIKLDFVLEYINNNIFFNDDKSIYSDDIDLPKQYCNNELIEELKKKLDFNEEEGVYKIDKKYNDYIFKYIFMSEENILIVEEYLKDTINTKYTYFIDYDIVQISSYSDNYMLTYDGDIKCISGKCINVENTIKNIYKIIDLLN